jgi:transposase-like protein
MMPPTNETVPVLSQEYGVMEGTLYTWRREALESGAMSPGDESTIGPIKNLQKEDSVSAETG